MICFSKEVLSMYNILSGLLIEKLSVQHPLFNEEEDYETIREIQNYFEDENAEITALCKKILQTQR